MKAFQLVVKGNQLPVESYQLAFEAYQLAVEAYQLAVKLISFLSILTLSLMELSRIKEGDGISIETVQLIIKVDN